MVRGPAGQLAECRAKAQSYYYYYYYTLVTYLLTFTYLLLRCAWRIAPRAVRQTHLWR